MKKWRKIAGDIIILHMCIKNHNQMMYGFRDTEWNGQNFFAFGPISYPFTPLTTWKIRILKKWKKTLRCYHFIHVYHKWQSYDVWFLRYGARRTEFFVIWGNFYPFYLTLFCPFTIFCPNNLENQNFKRKIKKTSEDKKVWSVPKTMTICYTVPEI